MDGRDRRWPITWEWWDAVIIFVAWVFISGVFAVGVLSLFEDAESAQATAAGVLVSVVLLSAVCVGWVAVRGAQVPEVPAVRRLLGVTRPGPRHVLLGLGYGVVAFVVLQLGLGVALTTLIELLGREVPPVQETVQEAVRSSGSTSLVVALGVVVLGPVGEELLYRGVLYQALARHVSGWPAIGLTGLAFGLTHFEPLVVVLTFPLGMLLAWLVRRHGTLVVPIAAHMAFNLIGFAIIRFGGSAGA